jgi:hypothetical protein
VHSVNAITGLILSLPIIANAISVHVMRTHASPAPPGQMRNCQTGGRELRGANGAVRFEQIFLVFGVKKLGFLEICKKKLIFCFVFNCWLEHP